MSVRRGATRFATVLTLLAGLVAVGAAPAAAAGDSVGIRLPSRFTAGGDGGSVSVSVSKRTDGCVMVRTALAIRLPAMPADQVTVEVSSDGRWRPVSVSSAGDGLVVTERTAPDRARLCRKRSLSVRYRVTFLDAAPGGRATIVGEVHTAGGGLIDRAAGTREVVNRNGIMGPTFNPPTGTPSPESTGAPAQQSLAAAPGGKSDSGGPFGIGTVVMVLGVAMVGLGVALLVLLLRRSRPDGDDPGGTGYPGGGPPPPPPGGGDGDQPTLVLPRVPY